MELKKVKDFIIEKKKPILIISVIVILTLIFGTKLFLYFNFFLGNDIIIKLESSEEYIEIEKGETKEISFKTQIITNPFCKSQCSSKLDALSNKSNINNESFEVRSSIPFEEKFNISSNNEGEGYELFRYSIKCNAIQTFFCHTKKDPIEINKVLFVNRKLTEEENIIKEQYISLLNEKTNLISNLNKNQILFEINIEKLQNKTNFELDISSFKEDTLLLTKYIKQINKIWNESKYEKIKKEFIFLNRTTNDLNLESTYILNIINKKYQEYNFLIDSLKKDNEIISPLSQQIISKYLSLDLNEIILEINSIHFERKINLTKEKNNIAKINFKINKIKESLNQTFNNKRDKLNLNIDEICNKTGTCKEKSNATNIIEICNEINKLIVNLDQNSSEKLLPLKCKFELINKINNINIKKLEIINFTNYDLNVTFEENKPICCLENQCKECCINCENENNPIIFLHGHSFNKEVSAEYSLHAFTKIQNELEKEGYLSTGAISIYTKRDLPKGLWGVMNTPLTIKVSYYFDLFEEPEGFVLVQTKSENIDTYAVRLKELLETVKYHTGGEKFTIIAHSMGGLVARRYLQIFGTENVDKLILIGTPNKGVVGNVADYCGLFGEKLECRDMNEGSLFLNKLNRDTQPNIPIYNFVGIGCKTNGKESDGVVIKTNAELEYANNIIINGTCKGTKTLHTGLLNIEKYPEVIDNIKEILK